MKICPNCSARNYNNAEICFNCKTAIANAPIYPDPVPQYPPMMNPYTQPACPPQPKNEQPAPMNEEPPKEETTAPKSELPKDEDAKPKAAKKGNPLLIVFAVIAGLLLITNGITLYYLLNSEQMKYKDAYISLQETVLPENLSDSSSSETEYDESKILTLQMGQQYDFEDFEIQIDSVHWDDAIKSSSTVKDYNYRDKVDGYKFFYLWGTLKNKRGESLNLDYIWKIEFNINDKYTYTPYIEHEEKIGTSVSMSTGFIEPLETKRILIYSSLPDEVYNIFDHCVVTIGYHDDFSYAKLDEFEELDNVYQLYVQQVDDAR